MNCLNNSSLNVISSLAAFQKTQAEVQDFLTVFISTYVQLNFDKSVYHLLLGFFWWWGEVEVPVIGVSLEIPIKKFENSELVKILDKELLDKYDWEFEDDGRFYFYSSFKPLTDFITAEDDNIPSMKKFLQSQLNTLYDIRKTYPKLFKK